MPRFHLFVEQVCSVNTNYVEETVPFTLESIVHKSTGHQITSRAQTYALTPSLASRIVLDSPQNAAVSSDQDGDPHLGVRICRAHATFEFLEVAGDGPA